jgi:hypothetical protein
MSNNHEKSKNVYKLILVKEIVLIKVSNELISLFISTFRKLNEISSFSLGRVMLYIIISK